MYVNVTYTYHNHLCTTDYMQYLYVCDASCTYWILRICGIYVSTCHIYISSSFVNDWWDVYVTYMRASAYGYMDICGYIWIYMDIYGYIWIYTDIYGYIWIHGYIDVYVTYMLIERNPPPRGVFLFTMFPHQQPCVRGPPSTNLVQILRGGSSYTRFLMRELSK